MKTMGYFIEEGTMIKNEDGQRTKEVLPLLSSSVGMAE